MSRRATVTPTADPAAPNAPVVVEEVVQSPTATVTQSPAQEAARAPPSTVVQNTTPVAPRTTSNVQSTTSQVSPNAAQSSTVQSSASGHHGRHFPHIPHIPHIPGLGHHSNAPVVGDQTRHPHILPHHSVNEKRLRRHCPRWCRWCLLVLLLLLLLALIPAVMYLLLRSAMKKMSRVSAPEPYWNNSDVSRRFHKDCVVEGPFYPHLQQLLDVESFAHMRDNDLAEILVAVQKEKGDADACHYTRRFWNDPDLNIADPRFGLNYPFYQPSRAVLVRHNRAVKRSVSSETLVGNQASLKLASSDENATVIRNTSGDADFPPLITNHYSSFMGEKEGKGWKIAVFARPLLPLSPGPQRDEATGVRDLAEKLYSVTGSKISKSDRNSYVWRTDAKFKKVERNLRQLARTPVVDVVSHSHAFLSQKNLDNSDAVDHLNLAATKSPLVNDGFDLQADPRPSFYNASSQVAPSFAHVFDGIFVTRDIHVGDAQDEAKLNNEKWPHHIKLAEFVYDIPKEHQTQPWKGSMKGTNKPKALLIFDGIFNPYDESRHASYSTFLRHDVANDVLLDGLKNEHVYPNETERANQLTV